MRCYGIYDREPLPRGGYQLVKLGEVWAWDADDARYRARRMGYFCVEVIEL